MQRVPFYRRSTTAIFPASGGSRVEVDPSPFPSFPRERAAVRSTICGSGRPSPARSSWSTPPPTDGGRRSSEGRGSDPTRIAHLTRAVSRSPEPIDTVRLAACSDRVQADAISPDPVGRVPDTASAHRRDRPRVMTLAPRAARAPARSRRGPKRPSRPRFAPGPGDALHVASAIMRICRRRLSHPVHRASHHPGAPGARADPLPPADCVERIAQLCDMVQHLVMGLLRFRG